MFFVTGIQAQEIPYVYDVENTGADYPLPPLPNLGSLPRIDDLPDPFRWADDPVGDIRSTAFSEWSHHRAEIKAQIEYYEIGTKPAVDPSQVTASYSGGTLTVQVTANGQTLTLACAVSLPAGSGPFPVVIGMNSPSGGLSESAFSSRNIARITYSHDQVTTYNSPSNSNPYYRLYPDLNIDNTGQYSAWAWGVSRIIDGLEKTQGSLPIDLNHIAVTGCSYAGKMALFAGAFDERIALTIAQESGGGGATSWRYSKTLPDGSVEGLAQTSHEWFKESMFDFGGDNVWYLPEDHHMLMAMCAPRALYVTGNTDYEWLSNPSCYVCSRAVQQIYSTLGIADRFGFGIDGGHTHCAFPSGFNADLNYFLDKFMSGQTSLTRNVQVYPSSYSSINYASWYEWWGTGTEGTPGPTPTPTPGPTAPPGNGDGLLGEYYTGMNFDTLVLTRVDPAIDFDWGTGSPDSSIPQDNFSIRWSGEIEPAYSETYTFYDYTDDGCRLTISGQTVIEEWTSEAPVEYTGTINLTAGQRYPIMVEFYEEGGEAVAQLSWSSNSRVKQIIPQDRLYSASGGNPGDVNEDGEINIVDALLVAQYYVGLDPSNFNINNADTNCDGQIDIVDALLIAQYYVGLVDSFC
ncbi:MAG: hypothetical protein JXB88_24695 [Spirochaetales bacterium]|nr:hypothetical protein [Spirochaetales bacterium]